MQKDFRMMLSHALVLTVLAAPAFAGSEPKYLALGDSISFGYHPVPSPPQPVQSYVGYPEILGTLTPTPDINLSCPGQSSSTFLDPSQAASSEVPGANCETITIQQPPPTPPIVIPGWKTVPLPLHNSYTGSQAYAAVDQLLAHKSIDLVTISIGGNDLLYVQFTCSTSPNFPGCVQAALPGALSNYGQNLAAILTRIRTNGQYNGTIVLVNNYALSTDPLVMQAIGALNQVMGTVGSQFGAKIADAYTAFQIASSPFGGDPCKAGLLARLSPTACDEHPSLVGQTVIATTVLNTIVSR
jgi:lysophospholipase L1-like esterase